MPTPGAARRRHDRLDRDLDDIVALVRGHHPEPFDPE
jgi:hypothetical protein